MSHNLVKNDTEITPSEIAALRVSVGWDECVDLIENALEKAFVQFSARDGRELIGFIYVLSDGQADAYLQDLMVHPDYQGKGIGLELVRAAVRHCQEAEIKCIQVTFNPEHQAFFKKIGFHIFKAGIIDKDTMDVRL